MYKRLRLVSVLMFSALALGCSRAEFKSEGKLLVHPQSTTAALSDTVMSNAAAALAQQNSSLVTPGNRLETRAIRGTTLINVAVFGPDPNVCQQDAQKVMGAYIAAPPPGLDVKIIVAPTVPAVGP